MKVFDISIPFSSTTPTWKNEQSFQRELVKTIAVNGANVSKLTLGSHSGTHIDAPFHFLPSGKTIEKINLAALIGPCRVIQFDYGKDEITKDELAAFQIQKGERILIGANGRRLYASHYDPQFTPLSPGAAHLLASVPVQLLGLDYLSVERSGNPGHPVHTSLLTYGVIILEGIDLSEVDPGNYYLVCLPLKIASGDGAPARAILLDEDLHGN